MYGSTICMVRYLCSHIVQWFAIYTAYDHPVQDLVSTPTMNEFLVARLELLQLALAPARSTTAYIQLIQVEVDSQS